MVRHDFVYVGVGGTGHCFPLRINGLENLDELQNNISIKDESTD